MKHIKLSQGEEATVDDDLYEWLNQWKWYLSSNGYVVRNIYKPKHTTVRMHVLVNQTPEGYFTDHKNGVKKDNRRENLRTCTKGLNGANQGKHSNNTSGVKGVHWRERDRRWYAQIRANDRKIHIGSFLTKEEAAAAHREAAIKYHGEFMRLQ